MVSVLIRVPYITPPFCSLAYSYPSYTFSLRFVPTRISYRSMHQAVDNVLLDTIFPASPSMVTTMLPEELHEELLMQKILFIQRIHGSIHLKEWHHMLDSPCCIEGPTCGILELP